jgi:hypothetical protein
LTEKITIKRHPDGWHVSRPAYGFGRSSTTVYSNGAAALASLTCSGLGSGSSSTDRGYFTLQLWSWTGLPSRRPRWIEASS